MYISDLPTIACLQANMPIHLTHENTNHTNQNNQERIINVFPICNGDLVNATDLVVEHPLHATHTDVNHLSPLSNDFSENKQYMDFRSLHRDSNCLERDLDFYVFPKDNLDLINEEESTRQIYYQVKYT